jgi:hypothetical protein
MRNYLYLWHDPEKQFIVASGLELKDFRQCFSGQGGLFLIQHKSELAAHDSESGLDFVNNKELAVLMNEDIYSWGRYVWVDFKTATLPKLTDAEVAAILFFAHKSKPLNSTYISGLNNQFMAYVHDDGWYLKLHYVNWLAIETLIKNAVFPITGKFNIADMKKGHHGFWLQNGQVIVEEKTHAIDQLLNRRL